MRNKHHHVLVFLTVGFLSTSTRSGAAVCGNDLVEGYEECDGQMDTNCPGHCSIHCACPGAQPRSSLELHLINVGQGDSLLVISPDGFVMLVDAGPESEAQTVLSYLQNQGVGGIDYTLVSHMHTDHLGGMDVVLSQHPGVVACFDHGGSYTTTEYNEYQTAAGTRRIMLVSGNTIDLGSSVTAQVLHGYYSSADENCNSVVLRITYKNNSFLLGGDCDSPCEGRFNPGPINVYKVHHHGSTNASSDAWLTQMTPGPDLALIPVGIDNPYGHPALDTLARLVAHGAQVFRTDLDGHIPIYCNGYDCSVGSEPSCLSGSTQSCGISDVGACQFGIQECIAGAWGACQGAVYPVPEVCNNGLDDDCDVLLDATDPDCASSVGHLAISQVGYDTVGVDSVEEFIDLYNPTNGPISLAGWTLADNLNYWAFPSGITLAASSYLSVARDAAGFLALYGKDPDLAGLSLELGNSGDRLILSDPTGTEVDRVAWENYQPGWNLIANTGDSIERSNPSVDSDSPGDWQVISPAAPRGGFDPVPPVCSNQADCDDGDPCTADTCLNPGTNQAACQNDPLVDNQSCGTNLVCCGGICGAPACLGSSDCADTDSCTIDTCADAGTCYAACSHPQPACGLSDGCCGANCNPNTDPDCAPAPGHLVIAQVGYDPIGNQTEREFVDLYNPTTSPIRLDGWTLTDNLASWRLPGGSAIAAGRYLTIARDATGFFTFYKKKPNVAGLSLSLGNKGDRLVLSDPSGKPVDYVAWEKYDPGWNLVADTGDSIERINPSVDTDSPIDWKTTSPATPRGTVGP